MQDVLVITLGSGGCLSVDLGLMLNVQTPIKSY